MPRYLIVDVFTSKPLAGNALAVFPDGDVPEHLMQRIAREMNLSETTFVSAHAPDSYDVRIFTPASELPFAGHPTLGTCWVLADLGRVTADTVVQRSAAGETTVQLGADLVWLEREGSAGPDVGDVEPIARALGVSPDAIGFDAAALGARAASLRPAVCDPGVPQLVVPLRDARTVAALQPNAGIAEIANDGVYCVAPLGERRAKARFFAPGIGIGEDPATGSAAVSLGLYLGARIGGLRLEVEQGAEIGRPSTLHVETGAGRARVGGGVVPVAEGTLRLD